MSLNFELSDEQKMIKQTVASIVKRFEGKREEMIKKVLKEKQFPQEIWDAISEAGFLGSLIPEEYGGTNMGLLALALAIEEMAANGFGNGLIVLTAMDALCILRNGSDELKKRFLPEIAKGKVKCCFALTEPDAGSNTFRISTLAKKNGNNYEITGQKVFITGVDVADYMLLVTRTTSLADVEKQGMPKAFGLSLFMVDTKSPGIEMRLIPTRGIEGMNQFLLFFDKVVVPAENMVGQENMGTMALFNTLNPERILASAAAVGVTEALLKKAVNYAKERKVFKNTPIGAYQGLQHPLAEVKIEQESIRLSVYRAAWAFDKGFHPGEVGHYANVAKYLAAELMIKAVDRAIETLGGYGFSEEYGIIRRHAKNQCRV